MAVIPNRGFAGPTGVTGLHPPFAQAAAKAEVELTEIEKGVRALNALEPHAMPIEEAASLNSIAISMCKQGQMQKEMMLHQHAIQNRQIELLERLATLSQYKMPPFVIILLTIVMSMQVANLILQMVKAFN